MAVRYYDWIAHHCRRAPDTIAAVDLASGRSFSYAQFDARISRLASHLRHDLKVARGDRVAVLALNTTDTLEVQFACGRLGAVFVPLNTRLAAAELAYMLQDCGASLLVVGNAVEVAAKELAADPELAHLPTVQADELDERIAAAAPLGAEVEVTLADPAADTAQLREMGAVVLEATEGANRLLTSLLVLARTQARGVSELQEVDLADLVAPTLQVNEAAIAERDLSVTVSAGPAPVSGDPALLGRLVGNLVENAVRHNVSGGWMTVTTGRADEDGHGDAILEIASSGPVIDAATVSELFEPFRQGQRPRTGQRGTGLGLSIVRAVVAAHHGMVDAAPVPDGGLRVRVRLPSTDVEPAVGP